MRATPSLRTVSHTCAVARQPINTGGGTKWTTLVRFQELVDQHKRDMPTGVATALMQKCQDAYGAPPKLYKVTWTMVDSHAHVVQVEDEPDFARVELSHKTQTLIVETFDGLQPIPMDIVKSSNRSLKC
jgi:hypothetical protein